MAILTAVCAESAICTPDLLISAVIIGYRHCTLSSPGRQPRMPYLLLVISHDIRWSPIISTCPTEWRLSGSYAASVLRFHRDVINESNTNILRTAILVRECEGYSNVIEIRFCIDDSYWGKVLYLGILNQGERIVGTLNMVVTSKGSKRKSTRKLLRPATLSLPEKTFIELELCKKIYEVSGVA
ncbi:hypothetical protein RRG08_047307 [Elysia crispata]|uniref:Uncharacterized protein n=1 Tax=Elysia crispata TaxID=231223 RepID=A0AAE1D6P4_9GAST|nr:hypothetical protein RRG08_047307 [Elysia crispata]